MSVEGLNMARKEVSPINGRPDPTFNQAPTGHRIPEGRSVDDPNMAFDVPDCGVKAGGEFSTPYIIDNEDLPTPDSKRNRQGF
jgi:hypothetical protein